jgi:NDP-sugar pyrophosphorylase family protein
VKGAVIAAGAGSRFCEAGVAVPKPLLEVAGESLLFRTLRLLAEASADGIALIVNEEMGDVARAARSIDLGVPLDLVIETTPSSLHSLAALRPHLEGSRFVLCTVDSIMSPRDFSGFVQRFTESPELDALLSYTDFVDDENPLRIAVAADERVTAVGAEAEASPFVTVGLYGMNARVLGEACAARDRGVTRLRRLLGTLANDASFRVSGHRLHKAIDVDRPTDLEQARAFLQGEERP